MEINNTNYSEIKRKIFHLLTLLYPVFYNILPRSTVLIIAGALVILDIIVESMRFVFPAINRTLLKAFSGIYRDNERNSVSALVWTFTGTFLTMFIFTDTRVVTVALLYMVFGDSLAGVIGLWVGRTKLGGTKKSLEGSFSCFVVCLLIGLFFLDWRVALLGAIVATIVELLPLPLNDNFWLPLISGFSLTFLKRLFLLSL